MPSVDLRNRMLTGVKGRLPTSGRYTVRFVDFNRKRRSATVLGPGSVSGLKLNIESHVQTRIIDNVPLCTADNQTQCYVYRP